MKRPIVVIIKASPWKTARQSRNHPEYSAIFDLLQLYEAKFNFILVGTSNAPTSRIMLKNGTLAWDIKTTGRFSSFTYHFDLVKLLLKYKPNLVIVLGLLNVLPVAIYSLLSRKSKYVPIFIGEFYYHETKKVNQILMAFGFKLLGTFLQLSQRKILGAFTLSTYTQEGIEKLAPKLSGKVKLISYPISPNFNFTQRDLVSRYSEEPMILTVAGIERRKGLDTLIKSVSLLPKKVNLVVKGSIRDNSYMSELMAMVKNLNLEDRVTFITKIIDYDALINYYKSAKIFVLPSREDCLGVVVLEALHCGLPVIATSVGGIPDMIEHGVNGILVKPDNPRELANAILLLLDDDKLRIKLAANSRAVLNSRYYQDRITLKEALIKSVDYLMRTDSHNIH